MHKRQRVDFLGAATLTVGVGLLLLGLQSGGRNGWLSTATLLELAGAIVLLAVFGLIERRVAAPLLTLDLLTRPVIAIPCLVGILGGAVLVGFAAYLPPLVQGGWGGTPTEAGLMVAPLSIGWPLASTAAGRLLKRVGFRALAFGGSAIVLAGTLMMLLVFAPGVSSNRLLTYGVVIVATFVSGLGFGSSTTAMLIAVQNSVLWNERGIATASVQFFRNMGNTIGAALLGAVLTATLAPALIAPRTQELLQQVPPGLISSQGDPAFGPANALLNLDTRKALPPPVRDLLSDALVSSLGWVFVAVALLAALAVVFAARFPRESSPYQDLEA
jgi:predicted MFS family arabinose efflux permease